MASLTLHSRNCSSIVNHRTERPLLSLPLRGAMRSSCEFGRCQWGPRRSTRRQQLRESLSSRAFSSPSKPRASVAGSSPGVRPDNAANVLSVPLSCSGIGRTVRSHDRSWNLLGGIDTNAQRTVENLGRSHYPTQRSLAREHEQRDTESGSFLQAMEKVGVLRCSSWK